MNQPLEAKPASFAARADATGLFDEGGDPLDVKTTAGRNAIPASQAKDQIEAAQNYLSDVRNGGLHSQSAAGKEVRCANPKCMVPVFVAPRIEKKAVEAPTPAKSGMSAARAWLARRASCYWAAPAAGMSSTSRQGRNREGTAASAAKAGPPPPNVEPNQGPGGRRAARSIQPVAEKPLTLAEERDAVLDQMEQDAQEQGAQSPAPLLPAGDRTNGGRLRRLEAGRKRISTFCLRAKSSWLSIASAR